MADPGDNIIWQGKSWNLRLVERRLSDGSTVETAYIDHPGSVVIVPWREAEAGAEVLMLRQYRFSIRDTILELPAGTRAWGEDLLRCAQRELREETGFRAGRFDHLGHFWPAPGVTSEVMNFYLATDLQKDPLPQDIDEEIEVVPFAFADLVSMALDGRIQDAKTIIGLLRTDQHLHEQSSGV